MKRWEIDYEVGMMEAEMGDWVRYDDVIEMLKAYIINTKHLPANFVDDFSIEYIIYKYGSGKEVRNDLSET